mmetsp:Transcript_65301/g.76715  ORF Transcript_65301/g.76715 Transcript_65301/m.76715 type:complete len:403 (-) Transcript_65301:514-1722(-)
MMLFQNRPMAVATEEPSEPNTDNSNNSNQTTNSNSPEDVPLQPGSTSSNMNTNTNSATNDTEDPEPVNSTTTSDTAGMSGMAMSGDAPSSTFILFITFLVFRMWVQLLSEPGEASEPPSSADGNPDIAEGGEGNDSSDPLLLILCLSGTLWVARLCRVRRMAEERAMERERVVMEEYFSQYANGQNTNGTSTVNGSTPEQLFRTPFFRGSGGGVGGLHLHPPRLGGLILTNGVGSGNAVEDLSFRAQLSIALSESRRMMDLAGRNGNMPVVEGRDGSPAVQGVGEEKRGLWDRWVYKDDDESLSTACSDDSKQDTGYGALAKEESTMDNVCHTHAGIKSQSVCSICLCEYEAGDAVLQLPCRHLYHAACIESWTKNHVRCPLCNYDLKETGESNPAVDNDIV